MNPFCVSFLKWVYVVVQQMNPSFQNGIYPIPCFKFYMTYILTYTYKLRVSVSVENSAKSLPVRRTGDLRYLPALAKSCLPTHWFYNKNPRKLWKVTRLQDGLGILSARPHHFYPVSGGRTGSIFNTVSVSFLLGQSRSVKNMFYFSL